MLEIWWVWVAAGLALAIMELFAPGYLFVGFAIGAGLTGAVIGFGLPGAAWLTATPINALTAFAIISLVVWLVLRRVLGVRGGQVKRIDRDINED